MRRMVMIAGLITMLAAPVCAGPHEIGALQACLTGMGYDTGSIDGIIGARTTHAFNRYMTARFGDTWFNVPEPTRNTFLWADCQTRAGRPMPTQTR